jgi:acetyltransferase-like isoleucine patch superfamily enzyme
MISLGLGSLVSDNVKYGEKVSVGEYSIVGGADITQILHIGSSTHIGSFCKICSGCIIGSYCEIDDYCAIYSNVSIGDRVKVLYGKKVYSGAVIGHDCIIGGNIPERMILDDRVTFMGEVAHSHYNPKNDWDTTDEPSPHIGTGSIIGTNALLIGGITIGSNCYVSAGEILRHDLPENSVFYKNKIYMLSDFRGLIQTRF